MTESSESSSSESSYYNSEWIELYAMQRTYQPGKEILKVMHVNKKSGNKKAKPRRNPTRAVRFSDYSLDIFFFSIIRLTYRSQGMESERHNEVEERTK